MSSAKEDQHKMIKMFERAVKYFWNKKYDKALADFEKIREIGAGDKTITDRASSFIAACEQRMSKSGFRPKTADEHYLAGVVRLNEDDLKESIKHLSMAVDKDDSKDAWLFSLACAYARDGQLDEATSTLEKAIRINGDNQIYARNCPDFAGLSDHAKFRQLAGDSARPGK